MSIEAIQALGALANTTAPAAPARADAAPQLDFGRMLGEGISKVDSGLQAADVQLRAMAAGKDVQVHDVMISMEEARMGLMFMVEVRNRAVEAYQELMRMQL
jgi:flagellar hook-basal body complex protein FliE